MKVKCLYNTGRDFHHAIGLKLAPNHWSKFGYSDDTELGALFVDAEYLVMGIIYQQSEIFYLIAEDNSSGGLYPSLLFEILDPKIPSDWYFRLVNGRIKSHDILLEVSAVMGYWELCFNDDHYGLLLDYDDNARLKFYKHYEARNL